MNNMQEMAKATNTKPAQAKANNNTLQAYVKSMEGEIAKALPSVITPERFTRIVTTTISSNPTLAKCSPKSFLGAMMTAAQLGMEVNTPLGQAYLIPYNNHGTTECQFQLGYKGLIDLAYRSGEISTIEAHVVHENDEFSCEYGLNATLKFKPNFADRGEPLCVYAMFKTKDGGYNFEVMGIEDIKAHAKQYSKAYASGVSPWATNFEEMAKKTVLKKVLKYAPLKSDFVKATLQDGTIKNSIDADMAYVQDDTDYTVINEDGEIIEPAKAEEPKNENNAK